MLYRHINIIKPAALEKILKGLDCDNNNLTAIDADAFEIPFEKTTLEEDAPTETFPNCCQYHKNVAASAKSFFDKFPLCCSGHQKLVAKTWFNKTNYRGIPEKIIKTLSHSEQHICRKIDNEDWYRDITDYFEYAISSFGQLPSGHGGPVGLHLYFYHLNYYIRTRNEFPANKRKQLLDYLKQYNQNEPTQPADINKLIATYNDWMNIFPFEISYFSHLKPVLASQIPLLAQKPVLNPYIGLHKAKLQTMKGLLHFLVEVTEKILIEINALVLHEKGRLTEPAKVKLEVINANRRMELKQLNETPCAGRRKYSRMLKQWFKGEIRYLKEIAVVFNTNARAEMRQSDSKTVNIDPDAENLFCKAMPLKNAINHFKVFIQQNSTNGKPFLTPSQFDSFIAKAFCGQIALPKQTFNCGTREKLFIVKRFYQLYAIAAVNYESTSQCKPKYISLLTDNFDNWSHNNIKHNFTDKVRRNW